MCQLGPHEGVSLKDISPGLEVAVATGAAWCLEQTEYLCECSKSEETRALWL